MQSSRTKISQRVHNVPQRKSPICSQLSYNSARTTRNSKARVYRDTSILIKNSNTAKSAKVSRAIRNLTAFYNPDASGILSQVTSSCGNVEMHQQVQPLIESTSEKEDSVKDNQDQHGQTHIIEDIDDEGHQTGRETAAISFEKGCKGY